MHTFGRGDGVMYVQGYKDIYSPVTLKCTQEFVLVALHSYNALTKGQNIAFSHELV